jgi:hypothetical protein
MNVVVPNYQEIIELLPEGLTLQAKEKLIELKEAAVTLQEENLALKQKLKQLESAAGVPPNLLFDKGLYWLMASPPDSNNRQGPFCQACFDRDKKLVHLHRNQVTQSGWFCVVCRNYF